MLESVHATLAHARALAAHLSAETVRSIDLFGPREPLVVILESMRASREPFAVSVDGELVFIWGVREIEPTVARGWFMTSDAVLRHRREFWQASKEIVEGLRAHYRVLTNIIPAENAATLRWAEGLGFTIYPREQTFRDGKGFHRAEIRRPDHV